MELTPLIAYATTIAVLALKPGAGVVAVISRAAERGFFGFFSYMSGALLGEIFYLGLVVFSLSLFEENFIFISIILKALASVYLIYLGFQALTRPSDVDLDGYGVGVVEGNWKDFSMGLMLTLSNPLVILVFGGVIPDVIGKQDVLITSFLVLALITIAVQISIDFMYCTPVFLSRKLFDKKMLNRLTNVSGVVMILIGLYLGYTALPATDLKSVIYY